MDDFKKGFMKGLGMAVAGAVVVGAVGLVVGGPAGMIAGAKIGLGAGGVASQG